MKIENLKNHQPGDIIHNIIAKVELIIISTKSSLSNNKSISVIEALIYDETGSIILKSVDYDIEKGQILEISNGILEVVEGELRLVSRPPASVISHLSNNSDLDNVEYDPNLNNLSFNLVQYIYPTE
ncbi:hypothetical protein CONCODRAFT_78555 [Conidiobolus coronatus NRRL 28638]|uniref:Replication factor A protein 3 n=1 Tax=Conidiobolus coronatus (strain ATCC 28846 / CBS 209.66 / NRRL 28638) TaxID=796925 RepID=A0A137P7N8_CONC2|nr:hypothetical protein CONCODRAFT_78555 [Conidiobolus coronatus NRRL 28638]|eukprot:KXN71018.1 hypothetical protein CONCODRAFT_78555 [Conidiobolus coronatus NRRL 28638]